MSTRACESGRRVIYFRFASHPPVVFQGRSVEMHELDPAEGFETFIARIHAVIEAAGRGALYVFDCLSELAADWYSDSMLGNFFMLTCPYLYDLETVAYFALFRNSHSSRAIRPITRDDPAIPGALPPRGGPLRPSAQGAVPLLAHDEHAAQMGGRGVPARDVERADLVDPVLGELVGPQCRHAAGLLGTGVPRGPADPGRRQGGPIPAGEAAGDVRPPQPHGHLARPRPCSSWCPAI